MTTYTHDILTQKLVDAAALWSTDVDYGANEQFSIVVPGTPALTTLDGIDLTPGRQVNLAYPVARTAAETAATFDAAEALLANYVGEAETGNLTVVPGGVLGSIIGHPTPNDAEGIYFIDGRTVTDTALAVFVTATQTADPAALPGFSVTGDDVTLADWRGRAIMSSGALGITGSPGTLYSDQNKSHRHIGGKSVFGAEAAFGTTTADGGGGNDGASNWDSANANKPFTSNEGGDEARPNAVAMPICIVGSRSAMNLPQITNAITAAGQTLTANADGTATWV